MVENVMAGGDSAARGIILGGILGYVHGIDAIPQTWRDGLNALPV
jgi:ADP-ribosylglycohydrolase